MDSEDLPLHISREHLQNSPLIRRINGILTRRILRFLASSLLLLGVYQSLLAQAPKGFVVDKIIAKVDNYIVLKSELEGAYQNYLANGGTASEASRCGLFSQLIMTKLLVASEGQSPALARLSGRSSGPVAT